MNSVTTSSSLKQENQKALGGIFLRRPSVLALGLFFCTSGCAYSLRADKCPVRTLATPSVPSVTVQYLGSGGFLLKRGTDIVLFGPVYSNPTAPEVFLGHEFRTEGRLVEALLPKEAADAQAIVIGHSHYDHLLDTPYIALHLARRANIYGSATTKHLLASIAPSLANRTPANEVVALDAAAAASEWVPIPNSRMRILPIPSEHSEQFRIDLAGLKWPLHAFRGDATEDLHSLPKTAAQWVEGRTFAYLLDFLDEGGEPEFRVYFQDSGTHPEVGYAPRPVEKNYRKIDVALICGGGEFQGLDHPRGIIANTRPAHVIVGHWEDFFVTQRSICTEGDIRGLPLAKPDAFMKKVRAAQKEATGHESAFLPCPTASRFQFAIDGRLDKPARKNERVTYDCSKTF